MSDYHVSEHASMWMSCDMICQCVRLSCDRTYSVCGCNVTGHTSVWLSCDMRWQCLDCDC